MSTDMDLPEPVGYLPAGGLEHLKNGVGPIGVWPVQSCNVLEPVFIAAQMRAVIAERDALRAQVEALRADAERYRWLRRLDHFASADALLDMDGIDTLDAAIDAAREGSGNV